MPSIRAQSDSCRSRAGGIRALQVGATLSSHRGVTIAQPRKALPASGADTEAVEEPPADPWPRSCGWSSWLIASPRVEVQVTVTAIIVISMRKRAPAVIRVTAIGGQPASLGWLAGVLIPPHVEVEFVDFGSRADIVITHEDEEVSVVGDLRTGERIIQTNGDHQSPVLELALLLLEARAADGERRPNRYRTAHTAASIETIARLTGSDYIPYGGVRHPLPSELHESDGDEE